MNHGAFDSASSMSNVETKQSVSAGFIQFYNHQVMNTIPTFEESKKHGIDLFVLNFTKWDEFLVNYDKDEIRTWCNANDSKILVGLTGAGNPVGVKGITRSHTDYWKGGINVSELIKEDMNIVSDWPRNENRFISGFYSSYEPLSTEYVEGLVEEYDKYLFGLSCELENWAEENSRDVILAFSGAVADHKLHDEIYIKKKAEIFSDRVSKIIRGVLAGKNHLKLVFILQDGSGARGIMDNQLAAKIRPFFVEMRNKIKLIDKAEFWPLVEAFNKDESPASKDSLKRRLENIHDLGWNSGTEEKYRVTVFDLPRFNIIMAGN